MLFKKFSLFDEVAFLGFHYYPAGEMALVFNEVVCGFYSVLAHGSRFSIPCLKKPLDSHGHTMNPFTPSIYPSVMRLRECLGSGSLANIEQYFGGGGRRVEGCYS